MQSRECEFHLRLHAQRAGHPASGGRGPSGQVVQQHGLAHARITAHHQDPALGGPDRLGQPVQDIAFPDTVRQSDRAAPPAAWLGVDAHTSSWLV